MTIRPKASEMMVGHTVEIIILCLYYLPYMLVFGNIAIWIHLDLLSWDMGLLGHLNWDKNVSYDYWAKGF